MQIFILKDTIRFMFVILKAYGVALSMALCFCAYILMDKENSCE